MKIDFIKASAAGNDFIMINNLENQVYPNIGKFVESICDRRFAIGADGVIMVEKDISGNYEMKYYNSDGSLGSLCGNGARSTARFIYETIEKNDTIKFNAIGKQFQAKINDISVKLFLPDFELNVQEKVINLKNGNINSYFLNTGSPHCVIITSKNNISNLDNIDVFNLGREIRYNDEFLPSGTNVNFIDIRNGEVFIRTYERGVEDETLACGTGSIASAIVCAIYQQLIPPITIRTKGKDIFLIDFKKEVNFIKKLSLDGPANLIFHGTIEYDFINNKIVSNKSSFLS